VITPFGCENEITKTDFITVHPLPIAKFNMNPDQTTIYNTIVQFKDQSIGDIQAWNWDFSNLDSANQQNPTFKFPQDTGNYPVTLEVTTTKSCKNDLTQLLRIGAEYNIFVPNSFTPNGDGQNDVFAPRALGMDLSKYSLIIYDRWGGIVFESTDLNQPWDGRVQGSTKMAQNGVYVWRIVAHEETDNAQGYIYNGTVNLIR
jgi:gliding motility-associated-like protein